MRVIIIIISLMFFHLLVGCRTISSENIVWRKSDLKGLKLSLEDSSREEWYQFNSDGSVSVTYGTKGGWIASPLFFWDIKHGILQIRKHDQSIFQEISLIKITKDDVVARNKDLQTVNYKIIHL